VVERAVSGSREPTDGVRTVYQAAPSPSGELDYFSQGGGLFGSIITTSHAGASSRRPRRS
jgi:hypothetical protein